MKSLSEKLAEVVEVLNKKYSFIDDFKIRIDSDKIKGGFYWMNYNGRPDGVYPFHEVFAYFTNEVSTVEKLYDNISKQINQKLDWQKWCDEQYAKDFNKGVSYHYDYSKIPY